MRIPVGIYYSTPSSPRTPLPVLASRLRTEIVDLTATHVLTQIFYNPSNKNLSKGDHTSDIREAKYTFPLYESCAIREFSAEIGSKFMTSIVKAKNKAKAAYKAAKAAGKQAALLEQDSGEVFTASIGNIPPGVFVFVVIKYVHELKQDIEVEGVRLVVPTIIAPKYGGPNLENPSNSSSLENKFKWNLMGKRIEEAAGGRPETQGLAIEVIATMSGSIRGIQSPSHPISVNIGSHNTSQEGDFSPKMARATLAIESSSITGLDKDFTLIINSTDISLPRAFLAPHPTLPSTSTLMVTLAPRFELPQQRPEVVFIVDRSGSMINKIDTLRSALHLFLASLPVGIFFNIISFGSRYESLWPTSQSYTAETLNVAKLYVDGIKANLGGTEMLAPCEHAVKKRQKDMKLEVLVLTDGEIWHTEELFGYINSSTSSGDARFFSLGVGESVSHLLVEGISRAGKGYSQIVGEGENMQKKIMRMLKAALTPHVNDWSIDWDGKSEIMSSFEKSEQKAETPTINAAISLFDPSCNPDNMASTPSAPLPVQPPILQAPTTIPPLYPFTRTILYILLTDPCIPPTAIHLQGHAHDSNTNSIHPLKLTIPVIKVTSPPTCLGLYSLLGRKLLQDLEEGRCGYLPASSPHKDEEGIRLGVKFGLASKWTSFVAVTSNEDFKAHENIPPTSNEDEEEEEEDMGIAFFDSSATQHTLRVSSTYRGSSSIASLASLRGGSASIVKESAIDTKQSSLNAHKQKASPNHAPAPGGMARTHSVSATAAFSLKATGVAQAPMPKPEPPASPPVDTSPSGLITALSRLQLFSGPFSLSEELLKILELDKGVVDEAKKRLGIAAENKEAETVFITCVVLVWLKKRLGDNEEEWELMSEKAKSFIESGVEKEEVTRMEAEAGRILGGI